MSETQQRDEVVAGTGERATEEQNAFDYVRDYEARLREKLAAGDPEALADQARFADIEKRSRASQPQVVTRHTNLDGRPGELEHPWGSFGN